MSLETNFSNLTEIIFILSAFSITFLIVSFIRILLEIFALRKYNTGIERDTTKREIYQPFELEEKKLEKMASRDYLHVLFVILPNLFISAILTYFIYKIYPFEPTIPNIVTITASIFGVLIASYFIYKSL